jgi:hypothetical protein
MTEDAAPRCAQPAARTSRPLRRQLPIWLAIAALVIVTGCTGAATQAVARSGSRTGSSPASVSASGQAAAKSACALFRSAVFPAVKARVQAGDLAALVRMEDGQPLNASGPVDPHAPYLQLVAAADGIAAGHVHLRVLPDLLSKLSLTIQQANPGDKLVAVSQAAQALSDQCAALGD